MTKIITTIICFLSFIQVASAQLPANANDISPLLIGENAPTTSLKSLDGKEVSFESIYSAQKTILIVYRGGWCPYCNRHLAEMQSIENNLSEMGYQIVAVSPDDFENLQKTEKSAELKYQLLSDSKGTFLKELGVAFEAPKKYSKMLGKYSSGENTNFLPVPSVFVLNKEGVIEFEFISPNFKKRLNGKMLLAVLNSL